MVLIEKAAFGVSENEIKDFLMRENHSGECDDSCRTADWNCPSDT